MIKKRKVLQVTGSLRIGGLETVALSYFKYLNKEEFDIDFLVFGNEKGELEYHIEKLGGKVLKLPPPSEGLFNFYLHIRKILKKEGPYDVVHSHPLFISGLVMKAAYDERVPIRIAHAHSARDNLRIPLKKKLYNSIMQYCLRKYSNNFLACSLSAGNYLFGTKFFREKGQILKNGIDLEKFSFDIEIRNKIRNNFNLDKKFVIGNIGRLSDVKNQVFVLEVFSRVKLKHSDTVLIIVGDGPEKEKLIRYAKELQIFDDVLFLGSRDDVNELLQGMDLLLFPSKYEGLGIVILEAQATGLRCLISDIIPNEVDITPLVTRLPLDENPDVWANEVLKYKYQYKRENTACKFIACKYDIGSVIGKIRTIYTKL